MVKLINFIEALRLRTFRFFYFYVFLSMTLAFTPLVAQTTIKGFVFDGKTREPIIGATIIEDATKNGAATAFDGSFNLKISRIPQKISIRYIGYDQQEYIIESLAQDITIFLSENATILNDVVVVGYGTQRRKELTGSVASVSQETLKQSSVSIDGLLGGAVAGLNVTQESGQPGTGSTIRIRGGNSVYASNEPLYVIDGFIYFSEQNSTEAGVSGIGSSLNPLASINPSDIESIEVLKDVSAKAIYGSRGANGVILVTTKKGTRGKNAIHYQYSLGIDQSVKKLNLLNSEQWIDIQQNTFHDTTLNNPKWIEFSKDKNTDTDWQNAVLRTGITQKHEISINGGDDRTKYLISGNYIDQQGIIINSGFKRYSGRLNLDRTIFENFTVGVNASANRSTQNALTTLVSSDYAGSSSPFKSGITNSLVYALFMPPVVPIYDASFSDGYNHYNPFELTELNYYGIAANPVADLETSIGQTINSTVLANFYARYELPWIKGLAAKFSAGTNVNYITQNFFAPPTSVLGINQDIQGRGSIGNRRTDVTQTEYLLTYTKRLNPIHFIDALAGYTYQKTNTGINIAKANHLESFDNLGYGQELPLFSRTESGSLHSIIGRINYSLLEKYNLTATFRADKSSRFSEGHRWGYFPSIGASWNVNDEEFFGSLKNLFPTLKIRATYGSAGNQEIGFNEFAAILDAARYGKEVSAILTNTGNKNLKWETTEEYNIGTDIGLANNRIILSTDVYYKKTSDLLSKKWIALEGVEQTVNFGNLTNKGFEFSVSANIVEQKDFTWSAAANFARNINTITALGENNYTIGDNQEQILRIGESVGSFYGFIYDGVVQTGEDVSKIPAKSGQTLQAGDVKLRDISGAGGVPDGKITQDDLTIIGSIQPDFTYGFSSNATYNRWDIFISFQGSKGNQIYNKLRRHLSENNKTYNLSADLLNAWTADKPSTEIPALTAVIDSKNLYSRYVEDASFLKLRNITIGYTLPVKTGALPVKFRFFISGQNLLTITKYKGYDPEVAGGIDTGAYPTSRKLLLGVEATF